MRALFEAIKASQIAHFTINGFPLELQLPPYLDALLHSDDDTEMEYLNPPHEDDTPSWGSEMSFGWGLPTLAPWRSLLLLDEKKDGTDLHADLNDPSLSPECRGMAEGLVKFLETVAVTLSYVQILHFFHSGYATDFTIFVRLADVASLLDWDLDAQVYPVVRWLVYHRRAKIVDTIHAGLKTAFAIPPDFGAPYVFLPTPSFHIYAPLNCQAIRALS